MKKICLSLLAVGIALSAVAQSKLDMYSRAQLRQIKMGIDVPVRTNSKTKAVEMRNTAVSHVNCLVKLNSDATVEKLEAAGATVQCVRGNIALVNMPVSVVEEFSKLDCIKSVQLERKVRAKMDAARVGMGVDKIHAGEDLKQAYTGKGVIAGIVDEGFEPNHINFKNADGTSRVQSLCYSHLPANATSYSEMLYDFYTPENISEYTTDTKANYHGTHTLGIMAGSFNGSSTVARVENNTVVVGEAENPFYGVATEADIVASCGEDLSDYAIAMGIEHVLAYADESEQPAVINLSIGSNYGARDGKTAISEYFDAAGDYAILCLAAGNEGDIAMHVEKELTADDNEVKTLIYPDWGNVSTSTTTYYNLRNGTLWIYSEDESEFTVDMVVVNTKRNGNVMMRCTVTGNTDGSAIFVGSPDYASQYDMETDINFTKAFEGYAGIGSMIDSENGRYLTMIQYFTSDNQTYNADGKYVLGFIVTGKDGQRIDCFTDGEWNSFNDYGLEGWSMGSCNGSISDMACGTNILTVGSWNTKQSWTSLDGYGYGYPYDSFVAGKVSYFSSYGTLIDGRNLPHVVAPGSAVMSSVSSYYAEYAGLTDADMQAKYTDADGHTHYWMQSIGTSMATPAVAGSIALWLEADPTLTIDDVKDIVTTTANKDSYYTGWTGDMVQWGAGKFDAYAGLKEVIRRAAVNSGVQNVFAKTDRLMVTSAGSKIYNVFLGGADEMNVTVYNLQGQPVLHTVTAGDEANVDASALSAGVYVLNVNGNHSERILIK